MISKSKKTNENVEPEILTQSNEDNTSSSMKIVDIVSVEDENAKETKDEEQKAVLSSQDAVSEHVKKKLEKSEKKQKKAQNKTPTSSKKLAVLGAFVFCFAVIGIISSIIFGVHHISNMINKTGTKATFKEVVTPLVIVDTPAFENCSMLDSKTVIQVGIWHFLMDEENKDKYEKDELGTLTVPQSDIEVHIKSVFGSDIEITHQLIPDSDFYIAYDEEQQVYYIPENPQLLPYSASILSITKNIDIYTVKVGYISPGPFWDIDQNVDDEPTKTMIYTIKKLSKDNYIVMSVEYSQTSPDATVSSSSDNSEVTSVADNITDSQSSSTPENTDNLSSENLDEQASDTTSEN